MAEKCRAKDPSTCRTHGKPVSPEKYGLAEKDILSYFAAREQDEKVSDNPSESQPYKDTKASIANYVYGSEIVLENMTPEEREEAEDAVQRITDLTIRFIKPNGPYKKLTFTQVDIFAEEIYYARGHGKQYPYEVAKPEDIRWMKKESHRMLQGILPSLLRIPDQTPSRRDS